MKTEITYLPSRGIRLGELGEEYPEHVPHVAVTDIHGFLRRIIVGIEFLSRISNRAKSVRPHIVRWYSKDRFDTSYSCVVSQFYRVRLFGWSELLTFWTPLERAQHNLISPEAQCLFCPEPRYTTNAFEPSIELPEDEEEGSEGTINFTDYVNQVRFSLSWLSLLSNSCR